MCNHKSIEKAARVGVVLSAEKSWFNTFCITGSWAAEGHLEPAEGSNREPRNMWQKHDSISSYHDGQLVTTNMVRHLLLAQRPEMLFRVLLLPGQRWMRHDGAWLCYRLPKLQSLSIMQYSSNIHVIVVFTNCNLTKSKWVKLLEAQNPRLMAAPLQFLRR